MNDPPISMGPLITMAPTHPVVVNLPILEGEIVPVDLDALQPVPVPSTLPAIPEPLWPTRVEPKRSLIRRTIDDPYWILVTAGSVLAVAIVGTVVYGVIQIDLAIAAFFALWGATIGGFGILLILLVLFGGGSAACAGLHCGGCK